MAACVRAFALGLVLLVVAASTIEQSCVGWVNQGPFGVKDTSATENVPDPTIIGAVNALVVRADVAFIGTTNGGVWRTLNIHTPSPHWVPLFDGQPINCTSIAALAVSSDAQRIVAGCGRASSWLSQFSEMNGIMQSLDGGQTFNMLSAFPLDLGIISIALPASNEILVAVRDEWRAYAAISASTQRGVWRSTNNGATFNKVAVPGLAINDNSTRSAAYRLAVDERNPQFVVVATRRGVLVSTDGGATFTLRTNGLLPVVANESTPVTMADNAVVAVTSSSESSRVIWLGYTMCPGMEYCVFAIYRSLDQGVSFHSMSEPGTIEPNAQPPGFYGLGEQGYVHFALTSDPIDYNIVYVGGSTQLVLGPSGILNAQAYSGRSFRGNFSATPANSTAAQWTALTHTGTAHKSSPHADSRSFVWDPMTGDLLHTCDGGIYVRTLPRTTRGDWFGRNGDLAISEYVSASYNSKTRTLVAGAQDNGGFLSAPFSPLDAKLAYGTMVGATRVGGDGGFTAADAQNDRMYVGAQFLSLSVFNSAGTYYYAMKDLHVQNPFHPLLVMNSVRNERLLTCIAAPISVCYDMVLDGPETQRFTSKTHEFFDVFVYGGSRNGIADAEVILAVSSLSIYAASSFGSKTSIATLPWGTCRALASNPQDYFEALLVCQSLAGSSVYLTRDFGASWTVILGNLMQVSGARWTAKAEAALIVVLSDALTRAYFIGTWRGVYVSFSDQPTQWQRLGSAVEFPLVFITQLSYHADAGGDSGADMLLAATCGRGMWTVVNVTLKLDAMHAGSQCPAPAPFVAPLARTPVDCRVSDAVTTLPCSVACGGGVAMSTRVITRPPANGGLACNASALQPTFASCATQACANTNLHLTELVVGVANQYRYFDVRIDAAMCNVTFYVSPVYGDPDIFISDEIALPSDSTCNTDTCSSSTLFGADFFSIDQAAAGVYHIGVVSSGGDSTYVLSVSSRTCPPAPSPPAAALSTLTLVLIALAVVVFVAAVGVWWYRRRRTASMAFSALAPAATGSDNESYIRLDRPVYAVEQ